MKMVFRDGLGRLYEGCVPIVKSWYACGEDCQLTSTHLLMLVGPTAPWTTNLILD